MMSSTNDTETKGIGAALYDCRLYLELLFVALLQFMFSNELLCHVYFW